MPYEISAHSSREPRMLSDTNLESAIQPTGMSPQRCLSALRSLRSDLDRAYEVPPAASADAVNILPGDELDSLKSDLMLDIDLRRGAGEQLHMTGIERTIYLPLITCVLALLSRIEPLIPSDAQTLLQEARGHVDRALQQLAKNDELKGPRSLS